MAEYPRGLILSPSAVPHCAKLSIMRHVIANASHVYVYVCMHANDTQHAHLLPVQCNNAKATQHQRSGGVIIPVLASQSQAAARRQTFPVYHR